MTKRQIAVLILGCLIIIAGFIAVICMSKADNMLYRTPLSRQPDEEALDTGEMSGKESDAQPLPPVWAGVETDQAKMSMTIPLWVYFIVFLGIALLVRREVISFAERSAEKSVKYAQRSEE